MDKARPFDIPKREVWEAFKKVSVARFPQLLGSLDVLRGSACLRWIARLPGCSQFLAQPLTKRSCGIRSGNLRGWLRLSVVNKF